MTILFAQFGGKDSATQSNRTVINNYCSSQVSVLQNRWANGCGIVRTLREDPPLRIV